MIRIFVLALFLCGFAGSAHASVLVHLPSLVLGPEGGGSDCGGACGDDSAQAPLFSNSFVNVMSSYLWQPVSSCSWQRNSQGSLVQRCSRVSGSTVNACGATNSGPSYARTVDGHKGRSGWFKNTLRQELRIKASNSWGAAASCFNGLANEL